MGMALYEHVFLARPDISAQQVEDLLDQYKAVVEGNGRRIGKTEYWGLKTLSYRIRKSRKAHYVLMNIDAPHAAVGEMERQMRLNEDILRFMTIRVEEHEEGPSIQMQRRERDERRARRDRDDRREDEGFEAGEAAR